RGYSCQDWPEGQVSFADNPLLLRDVRPRLFHGRLDPRWSATREARDASPAETARASRREWRAGGALGSQAPACVRTRRPAGGRCERPSATESEKRPGAAPPTRAPE